MTAPARRWRVFCSDCRRPRQVQDGVPTMDLRQWQAIAFVQDTWRVTPADYDRRRSSLRVHGAPCRRVTAMEQPVPGRRQAGRIHRRPERHAQRACCIRTSSVCSPLRDRSSHSSRPASCSTAAYGIFYTPVDMNTWCNQLHNVPMLFPITQQSDNFTPGDQRLQLSAARAGHDGGQLHRVRSRMRPRSTSSSGVRPCEKSLGTEHDSRNRVSGRPRIASAASPSDQQRAARTRSRYSRAARSRQQVSCRGPRFRRMSPSPAPRFP